MHAKNGTYVIFLFTFPFDHSHRTKARRTVTATVFALSVSFLQCHDGSALLLPPLAFLLAKYPNASSVSLVLLVSSGRNRHTVRSSTRFLVTSRQMLLLLMRSWKNIPNQSDPRFLVNWQKIGNRKQFACSGWHSLKFT